jgi:class 3 adenylate cyclase/tetratricopeptide (TPR) repeat protein
MRFCGQCAAPLVAVCPACGAQNPPENKFCGQCAVSLVKPAAGRFDSPETYTPKHLAEKILVSKTALEGERKQVTVLFADMKGSMELVAGRDPEEARKILDPVVERMMEAVHAYEGTVNQVMGDGIMALFGAPLAHEDHALRAGYAALKMMETIGAEQQRRGRPRDEDPQIRVGLNSGEVVFRSINNDLTMEYSAVGQTTHLAARMEQLAAPGSILATEAFARLTEGQLHFKPLGVMAIKGLAEPADVFQLIDAEPTRSRFQAASGRGLTRFVGRSEEMNRLRQALERTRAGQGQVVAVIGEPGTGKSRLFYEFLDSELTRGCLKVETGAVSYSKLNAFSPIRDLLKDYCQIEERDEPARIEDKLSHRVLALDESFRGVLPAFRSLLDIPVNDNDWSRLDPPQKRQQILEGVKRLLIRQSQAQPLIVAFENLQWIDAQTQAFLDSLIESLPTARILLVANYRPEYQHGWSSKTYYTQLRLDPLSRDSAGELLRVLLGDDPALQPLMRLLIDRTDGNPLFLEESVRHLIELNVLAGQWGKRRLLKAPTTIQVPPTVGAILAARIDRLPPDEKRLLQSAAVIGENVPFALLKDLTKLPEDQLRRSLAHLQASEFLYEANLFPDLEYTFKHALTHDVAYGSLLQETRRVLHGRIMAAIERLHPDRLAEQVESLASHAFRGAVWDKAVRYLRQASAKAVGRSAHSEAVRCLEQALAALKGLPESREALEEAIDIRLGLRTSLFVLGEIRRGLDYLHEAEELARRVDDPRRLGLVLAYLAVNTWSTGLPMEAQTFAQNALAIATKLGDHPLMVMSNFYLGSGSLVLGDYTNAAAFLKRTMALLEGRENERLVMAGYPAVMARGWLAWVLADIGEFEEGVRHGQDALKMAETFGQPFSLARTLNDLGYLYCVRGDVNRSVPVLERALALWSERNLRISSPVTMGFLGYAYALSGRVSEGLSLLQEAEAAGESLSLHWFRALQDVHIGETHLVADRLDEARRYAERALAFARERHMRGCEAMALRLLAETALRSAPLQADRAADHYRQARALAEELRMRPLVAHCELGLAKLNQRIGQQQEAREHIATAVTMYREMGMSFWLPDAEGMRELA